MQEADALNWPADFARRHGRKPRVLHIGNVANYAYINAKIQRRHGIDAYVMDPDFYHIMASPEWIELSVEGDHGDDFFPDWSRTSAAGYERPDWFVQGPFRLSIDYMDALLSGKPGRARQVRRMIDVFRRSNTGGQGTAGSAPGKPAFLPRVIRRLGQEYFKLVDQMSGNTADRPVPPAETELPMTAQVYRNDYWMYRRLYEHFDVIQGYTISGASALAADMKNVVAYELGTIRGLPFEDSPMGHLTKWVYQTAPAVIITNVDCIEAADRLEIPEETRALALHAYDVERAIAFSKAPARSPHAGDVPYFFAPARHHWKEGNLSWLKGNDVLIRAAGLTRKAGYDFRLVFVRWGQEIELSEALIREQGLENNVVWIGPQSTPRLWSIYCGAVSVIDQFRAHALGGVALDSMALGRRLITAYNTEMGSRFFETPPPLFNAKTEAEASAAMIRVLQDPEDRAGAGRQLQDWFDREHGVARQLAPQYRFYEALTRAPGGGPARA